MKLTELAAWAMQVAQLDGDLEIEIRSYGEWVPFDAEEHIRFPFDRTAPLIIDGDN